MGVGKHFGPLLGKDDHRADFHPGCRSRHSICRPCDRVDLEEKRRSLVRTIETLGGEGESAVAGELEVVQQGPAADPGAHITASALYTDSCGWLASACGPGVPQQEAGPVVFCATVSAAGLLQIFRLPDMTLVFDHAPIGGALLPPNVLPCLCSMTA